MTRNRQRCIRFELHAANPHCEYCGRRLTEGRARLDHIQPRSRGGGNGRCNLALVCTPCDIRKADRTPEELLKWATAIVATQKRTLAAVRAAG